MVSNPTPYLKSSSWVPDGILLPTNHLYLETLHIPPNPWWKLSVGVILTRCISPTCSLPWILWLVGSTIHSAVQGCTLDNFLDSSVAFTSLVSQQILRVFCLFSCFPIVITLEPASIVLHAGYCNGCWTDLPVLWSLCQSNLTNSFDRLPLQLEIPQKLIIICGLSKMWPHLPLHVTVD